MSKYKVGDILKGNTHGSIAEVTYLTPGGNVLVRRDADAEELRTPAFLDKYYTKFEPFFEVGKTYKLKGNAAYTYKIDKIYDLEERMAAAIGTNLEGKTWLTALNEYNFSNMEEISDNG